MGLHDLMDDDDENSESTASRSEKPQGTYVQPTKEDFDEFFDKLEWDFNILTQDEANTKELVYESTDILGDNSSRTLRIFSTVDKTTGKAREKGADAIRCVIWDRHTNAPISGKKKTLRIQTWEKNLKKKIVDLFKNAEEYVRECPKCGSGFLVERTGKYGDFLGCNRYPNCRYTQQPDEEIPDSVDDEKDDDEDTSQDEDADDDFLGDLVEDTKEKMSEREAQIRIKEMINEMQNDMPFDVEIKHPDNNTVQINIKR